MILIWLTVSLIFLSIEMLNPGFFFFLSFFCGALAASVAVLVTESITIQTFVFFGGALISFIILRRLIQTKYNFSQSHYQSNAYALIGKHGTVVDEIKPFSSGQVKIRGEVWSAKLVDEGSAHKGAVVEVAHVIGCHVIVKQCSHSKESQ